jgi:hypothetical protein
VEVSLPLSPPLVGGFQIFFFNMFHSWESDDQID